jgi:hypothetical protein
MRKCGVAISLLTLSCLGISASSAGPITGWQISASLKTASGAPLSTAFSSSLDLSAQLSVILEGTQLFTEGVNGCPRSDIHMGAVFSTPAQADTAANVALGFVTSDFISLTAPGCSPDVIRSDQLSGIKIQASVPVDSAGCSSYCKIHSEQSPAACVSSCLEGHRLFFAEQKLNEAQTRLAVDSAGKFSAHVDLSFDQLGPATNGGGPDLQVDADALRSSASIEEQTFSPTDCAMVEACVGGPGTRKLLKFDGTLRNLGDTDLILGEPQGNPLFEYSACHDHYHLKDMMLYQLIDPASGRVVQAQGQPIVGRKQGFCIMDILPITANAGSAKYDCSYQGISVGWADVYDKTLDCQWLDITGVPPGHYILRVTVNPNSLYPEANSTNNAAETPVTIS